MRTILSVIAAMLFVGEASSNDFLNAINAVRASHGKGPLAWSEIRASNSQVHANFVARRRGAFHPRRVSIGRGEIMARGQSSIEEACAEWLNSPGHRSLLLGDFRACGAARAGNVWFVQFE